MSRWCRKSHTPPSRNFPFRPRHAQVSLKFHHYPIVRSKPKRRAEQPDQASLLGCGRAACRPTPSRPSLPGGCARCHATRCWAAHSLASEAAAQTSANMLKRCSVRWRWAAPPAAAPPARQAMCTRAPDAARAERASCCGCHQMNSTTSTADFLRAELEKDEGMKVRARKRACARVCARACPLRCLLAGGGRHRGGVALAAARVRCRPQATFAARSRAGQEVQAGSKEAGLRGRRRREDAGGESVEVLQAVPTQRLREDALGSGHPAAGHVQLHLHPDVARVRVQDGLDPPAHRLLHRLLLRDRHADLMLHRVLQPALRDGHRPPQHHLALPCAPPALRARARSRSLALRPTTALQPCTTTTASLRIAVEPPLSCAVVTCSCAWRACHASQSGRGC